MEARLFERFGPLKVKPTEAGRVFARIAGPDLERLDSIRDRFYALMGREGPAVLRIAASDSVLTEQLPGLILNFRRRHPKIKIQLFRKNRTEIINMVLSDEADFGITSLDKAPPGAELQIYAQYKRMLVAPKGHPLLKSPRPLLVDIAKHPLILPPGESNTREVIERAFQKAGLPFNVALEVMGREAAKKYVSAGLGLSIMSEFYLLPRDKKRLAWRDSSNHFGQSNRAILTRKGKKLSPTQEEFIRLVEHE